MANKLSSFEASPKCPNCGEDKEINVGGVCTDEYPMRRNWRKKDLTCPKPDSKGPVLHQHCKCAACGHEWMMTAGDQPKRKAAPKTAAKKKAAPKKAAKKKVAKKKAKRKAAKKKTK